MQEYDSVIAILCSDIHLSLKPPRARRKESDWLEAMRNALNQLSTLSNQYYNPPILCAGDIFDYWRAEPELINFALNHLPTMYAIPGQHDLPLHNIDLIERSAFWTLVLAEKIYPVVNSMPVVAENDMVIHGFPWGEQIKPYEGDSERIHIALCHDYLWTGPHHFTGAPLEHEAQKYKDRIKGYSLAVFGDNHKGFLTSVNNTPVFNCGGFMRRKIDEAEYEPQVGLLCKSGQIIIHKLSTSHERLVTKEEEDEGMRKMMSVHDLQDFVAHLSDLQRDSFDFLDAIEYAMKEKMVDNKVRKKIIQALGIGE